MKSHIFFTTVLFMGLILTIDSMAQSTTIDKYFDHLPRNLETLDSGPLQYRLTINWNNKDIEGKLMNHNIAIGTLTKGLENDSLEWSDVILIEIRDSSRIEMELKELNGLRYKINGDNFTRLDFYKDFPQSHIDLIRWFVQDQVAFDVYGLMYLDSLTFNTTFYPNFFRNLATKIDDYVNVNTKNLNITWTGISKFNQKMCALIHYQTMYNPIDANNDAMILKGRTCFWGDIWISLNDRQIELATMNEDLIFKMQLKANKYEQRINLQREIRFEKIK